MSRLPLAFGAGPYAGGARPQAASKLQASFEQDNGIITEKANLISREGVDATLQGGDLASGVVICWHPKFPIVAVATSAAVVEYDALSGCRRNLVESSGSPVKLRYTHDGEHLILLTKERNIVSWATSSWRRRSLLVAEARYAERPLVSGLLAVSGGLQPVIFYSPVGKTTLRTVHLSPPDVAKGSKAEKEFFPGQKLKTDNKKPIVGLAAHPTDRHVLFLLLVDGSLLVCGVGAGSLSVLCSISVPFDATRERVQLQATQHPTQPGSALVMVEAERSGLTILTVPSRNEIRILGTLGATAGAAIAGSGLLHRSCLLVVALRHAGGNVGLQTWRLQGDSYGLSILPTATSPSSLWDALQSDSAADASSLADVSGEALVAGMLAHGPSGLLAFWTERQGEAGAAHFRVPLLAVVDGGDPLEGLGAAKTLPLHTAPSFWTAGAGPDGFVSKLRFPRYAHALNYGRVSSYDLTHGLLADFMAPPPRNAAGQERALVHAVRSAKQGLLLAFMRILSPSDSAPLGPGQMEFTAVAESQAAVEAGSRWLPGRDAAFIGPRDELVAVLSNSGRLLAVFDTAKLGAASSGGKKENEAPRAQFVVEIKVGTITRLFPGPPSHIPMAPEPRPEEPEGEETDEEAEEVLREWDEREIRRLEVPKRVLMLTEDNKLRLVDATQASLAQGGGNSGSGGRTGGGRKGGVLELRPAEAVIQVAWQTLMDPGEGFHTGSDGAEAALPCAAAVLTSERVVLVDDALRVLGSASFAGDVGVPTSALWVGPALLVTTSFNQVVHFSWDGRLHHMCSLLSGPPAVLVAALADRLVLAARGEGPALLAGKTEVASRGFSVMPPMLVGWAAAASQGFLPGGAPRARREMRTLLASYDASQLPVAVLDALAAAGFADVAAAAAARSELPSVTPARKAALAAAAGDWSAVVNLVESELEASEWHPGPPPPGSVLYKKAVALARTCEAHGRFTQARALFEAAGAWNELLALCVFQGDFSALQGYSRQAGRDVEGLADQLLAVNENNFMRLGAGGAFGGRPSVEDWTVEVYPSDKKKKVKVAAGPTPSRGGTGPYSPGFDQGEDEEGSDGGEMDMDVAPAGRLPFMEASLRVSAAAAASGILPLAQAETDGAESGQPIAPLDLTSLDAYLGVAGASLLKNAIAAPTMAGAAAAIPTLLERTETEASTDLGAATAAAVMEASTPRGESASAPDSEADASAAVAAAAARGETLAQSSARAAFKRDTRHDDEDDFFSSDEDSERAGDDSKSATSFAASTTNRFLFKIRSPDELPRSGSDTVSLRAAVSNLQLGGSQSSGGGAGGGAAAAGGPTDSTALRSAAMGLKLGGSSKLSASSTPRGAVSGSSTAPARTSAEFDAFSATSSVASMDLLPAMHGFPTIATPPPAAPLASTPPAPAAGTNQDPFAAFAAFGSLPDTSSAAAAAPAAGASAPKDPFALLPGLPPTLAQGAAAAAATTAATDLNKSKSDGGGGSALGSKPGSSAALKLQDFSEEPSGAPMRPQAPSPVPSSDLLAGWDEFEALFGGGGGGGGGASTGTAATTLAAAAVAPATVIVAADAASQQQQEQEAGPAAAEAAPPQSPTSSAAPPAPALVPPPNAAKKAYGAALTSFRRGLWAQAGDQLAKIISSGSPEKHKNKEVAAAFRAQCVVLYAAAMLVARASAAPPVGASRLSRYAAALPMAEEQKAVTTAFAVEANMAAGNFGWAGDQLAWLVVVSAEGDVGGPGLEPAALQDRLAACDRAGSNNSTLSADEDTEAFVEMIASCREVADVEELLSNLL